MPVSDAAPAQARTRVVTVGILGGAVRDPRVPPHLQALADGHAVATMFPTRLPAFATTPYDRLVVDVAYVEAAQRAADAGCDAIFIDSFADYGIAAMRAAVGVPVIGAGEAGLAAAGAGGRRYSIVTVWPRSMGFLYDERLRMLDDGGRCVAVHHVSPETEVARLASSDGVMQRMQRREDEIIERLVEACMDAARVDGVDCVLLGCTCMAPVGPIIAGRVPFPVVECSRTGFHAAVSAARDGTRSDAIVPERRRSLMPRLVAGFLGETGASPGNSDLPEADCPVCVFSPRDG